jgi:hypothetical protein
MNPAVAKSVPNSPEAMALVHGNRLRGLSFGGLLTKLVEVDAVPYDDREAMKKAVCDLIGLPEHQFEGYLKDPDPIRSGTADKWSYESTHRLQQALKEKK